MKCVPINLWIFIVIILIAFCSYLIIFQITDLEDATECYAGINGLSELDVKSIIREVPDTRDFRCPRRFDLSAAARAIRVSIIITYHNESLSTLLTTIHSIYKRTPLQYLQEIILIDDFSENDFTFKTLATQLRLNPCPPFNNQTLVRSVRNSQRMGLIKSRNMGAQLSRGNYLMFMDSHCEVNQQWLESLLDTMMSAENDRMAVSPLLDNIDVETREYKTTGATIKGGFDWNLHFHWIARDKILNPFTTFRSPTFAGGVFLISRNWFFKLKAFNTRLELWGGESLEFSLKLWLCGGEIRIVPCSRVGHVFRKEHIFKFPQDDGQSIYLRNSKVIAETWLDHYKYNFYNQKPEARNIPLNISRSEINFFKNSLNCHNFEWYLINVFPELRKTDNFTAAGTLAASDGIVFSPISPTMCIHQDTDEHDEPIVAMNNCLHPYITTWFLLRSTAQLQSDKGWCLNVRAILNDSNFGVVLEKCSAPLQQKWQRFGLQLRHSVTGLCLETMVDYQLTLNLCRRDATTQYFRFSQELEKL